MTRNILTIFAVATLISGCNFINPFWSTLKTKLDAGQTKVMLSELTDYEWETVCVIEAYTINVGGENARVHQYIPYNLGEFEDRIPALDGDGAWAFAFIKDGTVISIEEKGYPFYLKAEYASNCISNKLAAFVKSENPILKDYLIITDKP